MLREFFRNIKREVQQLRWKLILSYTLVSVGAFLILELLLLGIGFAYFRNNITLSPEDVYEELEENWVPLVQPYLAAYPQDIEGLQQFLQQYWGFQIDTDPVLITENLELEFRYYNNMNIIFLDEDGIPVDAIPHDIIAEVDYDLIMPERMITSPFFSANQYNNFFVIRYSSQEETAETPRIVVDFNSSKLRDLFATPDLDKFIARALDGESDIEQLHAVSNEEDIIGALPVRDPSNEDIILGVLVFSAQTDLSNLLPIKDIMARLGYIFLIFTIFTAIFSTFFGSLTASNLADRIQKLSHATNAWSKGDFTGSVEDEGSDELSHLTQDINAMIVEFEGLLNERQLRSIMEERNRLARDLHDSVKQQAFAASAQLGAAKALIGANGGDARKHLDQTETLIDNIREELTDLIYELRPSNTENGHPAGAVQTYVHNWADRISAKTEISIQTTRNIPARIEDALLRITQEALSNISRHSDAENVKIHLFTTEDQVRLTIEDDGRGFDYQKLLLEKSGLGLQSMQERARLLNGSLSITSEPGSGTMVDAGFRIPEQKDE